VNLRAHQPQDLLKTPEDLMFEWLLQPSRKTWQITAPLP